MQRERVTLFGGSGTMGFEAFKELSRRDEHHVTLLLLPGDEAARRIRPYARRARLPWRPPKGSAKEPVVERGERLSVVWGDARDPRAVKAAVEGADHVLNAMAVISPAADYRPELAREVNDEAIGHILNAIAAEPRGAERISYVHTGTVAATGNRPPGIHVGRVGDPLNPSIFDAYALTKIRGERRVLESPLKRWVSLRMSFIMPTDQSRLLALFDPILFHMPLDTRMESITDRDAGFAMVQCLDQPPDSAFWRRVYNVGGGPGMRTDALNYLNDVFGQFGLDWAECTERNWYALRNFHLQYYEDSAAANDYLKHWRDDNESFREALLASMPLHFRLLRWLTRRLPPVASLAESFTHAALKRLAEGHLNSPRHWYLANNRPRLDAFFGGREAYEAIPPWGGEPPINTDQGAPYARLEHGYNEGKARLTLRDLTGAAQFRGGECLSEEHSGSPHEPARWRCAFGHEFSARPLTVLHAGHWCETCVSRWNGSERARKNPFFAQVWYANFGENEEIEYTLEGISDIAGADAAWRARGSARR